MEILSVRDLCKSYPGFTLDHVSFSLESGYIMGFIGRNGAGKTTTLKAMLGLVHPDGGEVEMFGMSFVGHEAACKQGIGLVLGGVDYYPHSRLRDIAAVTSRFYSDWDDAVYREYLARFALDEHKRVKELSAGMRVKFSLALALSHGARLLLLDEPTSGLDPVSRDELLDIFRRLVSDGEHSILFSTHIITDLEKCADTLTYIQNGRILCSDELERFRESYVAVTGDAAALTEELRSALIGCREHRFGFEGMLRTEDAERFPELSAGPISLEEIMVHMERT